MNTKTKRFRKNRRILGRSIAERPLDIEDRTEFGHWEIDTVEGKKSDDSALLTLVERKTRNYYAILLDDQNHESIDYAMNQLQQDFGDLFSQVFKTITSDNGSEFSNLALGLKGVTDVYFAPIRKGLKQVTQWSSQTIYPQEESHFRLLEANHSTYLSDA